VEKVNRESGVRTASLGNVCRVQTTTRMYTAIVFAVLAAASVVSAAIVGSITFVFVRIVGVGHGLAISAVVAAVIFLANGAAFALANARSESDVRAGELPVVEEVAVHARAS
jgi:hypothetical protein